MSTVHFASMRVATADSILAKLKRLILAAGLEELDLEKKYVAIKVHFGEEGNTGFLKPIYARAVAEEVIRLKGRPFVTDCNTLYPGLRNDTLNHLRSARLNGFNHDSCGCEVLIADGLRGDDEVILPLPDGTLVKEASIGRTIIDADVIISLSHAKGCMSTGYAGAIKNVGMGCGTRSGKMIMHSDGTPHVIEERCIGCKKCFPSCAQDALSIQNKKLVIGDSCVGCGHCLSYCPQNAIFLKFDRDWINLQIKTAEYATAVVREKDCFHICMAVDVTPNCDCFTGSDLPIVPNIGMFASRDIVAIDQAVSDAINAQHPIEQSVITELHEKCDPDLDHLHAINPTSDYNASLEHVEKLGAGSRQYELVTVE